MEVKGKWNVEMENGEFQDVLYVPNLIQISYQSTKLLTTEMDIELSSFQM